MKKQKKCIAAAAVTAAVVLGGCGTMFFFPYQAAEKAVDKVLDGIVGADAGQQLAAELPDPKKP